MESVFAKNTLKPIGSGGLSIGRILGGWYLDYEYSEFDEYCDLI